MMLFNPYYIDTSGQNDLFKGLINPGQVKSNYHFSDIIKIALTEKDINLNTDDLTPIDATINHSLQNQIDYQLDNISFPNSLVHASSNYVGEKSSLPKPDLSTNSLDISKLTAPKAEVTLSAEEVKSLFENLLSGSNEIVSVKNVGKGDNNIVIDNLVKQLPHLKEYKNSNLVLAFNKADLNTEVPDKTSDAANEIDASALNILKSLNEKAEDLGNENIILMISAADNKVVDGVELEEAENSPDTLEIVKPAVYSLNEETDSPNEKKKIIVKDSMPPAEEPDYTIRLFVNELDPKITEKLNLHVPGTEASEQLIEYPSAVTNEVKQKSVQKSVSLSPEEVTGDTKGKVSRPNVWIINNEEYETASETSVNNKIIIDPPQKDSATGNPKNSFHQVTGSEQKIITKDETKIFIPAQEATPKPGPKVNKIEHVKISGKVKTDTLLENHLKVKTGGVANTPENELVITKDELNDTIQILENIEKSSHEAQTDSKMKTPGLIKDLKFNKDNVHKNETTQNTASVKHKNDVQFQQQAASEPLTKKTIVDNGNKVSSGDNIKPVTTGKGNVVFAEQAAAGESSPESKSANDNSKINKFTIPGRKHFAHPSTIKPEVQAKPAGREPQISSTPTPGQKNTFINQKSIPVEQKDIDQSVKNANQQYNKVNAGEPPIAVNISEGVEELNLARGTSVDKNSFMQRTSVKFSHTSGNEINDKKMALAADDKVEVTAEKNVINETEVNVNKKLVTAAGTKTLIKENITSKELHLNSRNEATVPEETIDDDSFVNRSTVKVDEPAGSRTDISFKEKTLNAEKNILNNESADTNQHSKNESRPQDGNNFNNNRDQKTPGMEKNAEEIITSKSNTDQNLKVNNTVKAEEAINKEPIQTISNGTDFETVDGIKTVVNQNPENEADDRERTGRIIETMKPAETITRSLNDLKEITRVDKKVNVDRIIDEVVNYIKEGNKKSITLAIEPEKLGHVKLSIEAGNNVVNAKIEVESAKIMQMLQNNSDMLKNVMQQSGIQLNSLSVFVGNSEEKANNFSKQKKKGNNINLNKEKIDGVSPAHISKNLGYNTYDYIV